jgi:hypothetical protein
LVVPFTVSGNNLVVFPTLLHNKTKNQINLNECGPSQFHLKFIRVIKKFLQYFDGKSITNVRKFTIEQEISKFSVEYTMTLNPACQRVITAVSGVVCLEVCS